MGAGETVNVLEAINEARATEFRRRIGMLALWRDCCMDQARDWRDWQESSSIDLSADIARNVAEARRWNIELIRLVRKRKLQ